MDPTSQFMLSSGAPVRRRKTDQGSMNPIEATVTKLLVATKQLLEGLTLWSTRKMGEEQVSDIFVQLATQFNMASQAFHEVGIDTSELAHIPDDLRNCLETALGEDPSPSSLDQYLPRIKEVIINLLQGLRLKQNLYREQHEAKTARIQAAGSARSKSSGSTFRQPSTLLKPPEDDVTPRNSIQNVAPSQPYLQPTARDEQGHAETLASLRKSDAITRRASSRRHSQRFSTLIEQNTPPVPRRNHMMDPGYLSAYPGYTSGGSQGSTPATSPNPAGYGQSPQMPMPEPYVSGSSSSSSRNVEPMPLPPTIPIPPPPTQSNGGHASVTTMSPVLGSSSMTTTPMLLTPEISAPSHASPSMQGSSETINTQSAPTESSAQGAASSMLLPTLDVPAEPVDQSLTLFLQVGKSVKKTKYDGELTLSALRMLFMEKFQYNPGQEDFPTIYVKDPNTNIHYELESLADVKQNAFLSLNVDDLENIQRRMDQGFASLTKELSEIKKAQEVSEAARQKALLTVPSAERTTASTNVENSPALRAVVQKAIAKVKPLNDTSAPSSQGKISVTELKAQQEEIQALRRELGTVRQLYSELQTETKTTLTTLAGYTSQIRKQATETPFSSRLFIETGKVKLDKMSEELTNKIEDLQDVVEDMKVNVTQRRGRPSETSMSFVDKQCDEVGKDITELSDYIQTLRPSWKKTWEVELQTIVKEQMFLKEQEALLEDLKEDKGSLVQTLGNLKKFLELQSKNGGVGSRSFVFQPVVDDGFEGLKTVMEEVKMIEPDSDKRLKAMAQMEKLRHIDLSNRIDEFEEELTTFVGSSKLRKTGGALEIDRQRQQRDQENLKALFGKRPEIMVIADLADGEGEEAAVVEGEEEEEKEKEVVIQQEEQEELEPKKDTAEPSTEQ